MSDNVALHDFGREAREYARKLSHLLNLRDQHEAAVLRDPLPYLKKAHEKIAELQTAIREAQEALYVYIEAPRYDAPYEAERPPLAPEIVRVPRAEYERLRRAATLLEQIKL
jgi:hypothetical protein